MGLGGWLLDQMAAHKMNRAEFITRVGFSKSSVSKWITGEGEPSARAIVAIARVFRVPPETVLFQLMDDPLFRPEDVPVLNLPPHLTQGESRLVEHLAWAVRHWREEQNAARSGEVGSDVA